MDRTEPTPATPLPLTSAGSPVRIWLDDHGLPARQPPHTHICGFEATRCDDDVINGSLIASNEHFIVYVVKNGLLRLLYKDDSSKTTVMRDHKGQRITDVQFFQDKDNVFASVASRTDANNVSSLIVWKASYDKKKHELSVKILFELRSQHCCMRQLKWHPFNMNQFCLILTDEPGAVVGTLLNVEALHVDSEETEKAKHKICLFHTEYCIEPGFVQVKDMEPSSIGSEQSNLTDFAWANPPYRVLSTHDNGNIIFWDCSNVTATSPDGYTAPTPLVRIQEDSPVTRCLFLPHAAQSSKPGEQQGEENAISTCFLTASNQNAVVTLWSAFTGDGAEPTKMQIFGLERPSASYSLNVADFGGVESSLRFKYPPSAFVIMADRIEGKIFVWHLSTTVSDEAIYLNGCDYVVPFACKLPTFSCHVWTRTSAQGDDANEYDYHGMSCDILVDAYQSTVIRTLVIRRIMLLPPINSWTDPTPVVRVERLWPDADSE